MFKLMKHQADAVNVCLDKYKYALFFDCGTGKTLTAMTILKNIFNKYKCPVQTLIVTPLSVCPQWLDEFTKFYPRMSEFAVVATGTKEQKIEAIKARKGITIINTDSFSNADIMKVLYEINYAVLVVDESHCFKNYNSKRTKAMLKLADTVKYKYILTGTPSTNGLMDLWSQFRILDKTGEILDNNFFVFRARYFYDANFHKRGHGAKVFPDWRPQKDAMQTIKTKIRDWCSIVNKSDVLDLPEHIKIIRKVQMTPEQKRIYNDMKKNMITEFNGSVCTAQLALVKLMRLQQINVGIFKDTETGAIKHIEHNREEVLKEVLESIPEKSKVIVWTVFEDTYERIVKVFERVGRKAVTLTGNDTSHKKQENIDSFTSDDNVTGLVANQASGGTGLNLTKAQYAIYYTKSFNLAHDIQSEARNYRQGSQQHDKIIRIDIVTENSIDEKITKALYDKKNIADEVMDSRGLVNYL